MNEDDTRQPESVLRNMSENHIRVAVVGNVDAGKSTFIGSQVSSSLDDGRGSARVLVMKHKHERVTGRTSTIGTHLFGMDENAKPITGSSEGELARKASRLVTFMDLAGHEKYLKTTIAGVARGMADYALVLVNSLQPPTHMTLQHLKLCVSIGIPVVVVMTKVDRCSSHVFQATKQEIQSMLRSPEIGLKPFMVRSKKDIDTVKNKISNLLLTAVVSISCVTGEGLDIMHQLLAALPQRRLRSKNQRKRPFEFLIEEQFQVPGLGTVISGFVTRGEWQKGESLFVGPLKDGTLFRTTPKSAHVARTLVDHVWAGHSVCFAISKPPRGVRNLLGKGMVALKESFQVSRKFTADVVLVKGNTITIAKDRFVTTAHILHNKQSVRVIGIHDVDKTNQETARQGDRATITFDFTHRPFYVRQGMRIILRDGHVRGYGVIIKTEK